jgi:PilZ domain-containing protein
VASRESDGGEKEGHTVEYRRRTQRQPTAWAGFCHIDGESPTTWRDCEVVDVSRHGLGITFHHPRPWELVHRRIFVDVSAIGEAVTIRLEGVVRDAAFTLEGDIRVGIEFIGLSQTEMAITAVLGGINRIQSEHVVPSLECEPTP